MVDSHAEKLLTEYEEQLNHIQTYLDSNHKSKDTKEKEQEIEKADLLQKIETALNNLENFQSKDCANEIEEILEYHLAADTEAALDKIREQLKLYEDDAAEQMLRELIEQIQKEA